ncbi:MAG: hypothetical protein EXR29_02685 [Betaproteobacteria bacterium]|nr:hypothetical protein [Betaproteobacteria bacterium]
MPEHVAPATSQLQLPSGHTDSPVTPGIEPLARMADMAGFDVGGWVGIMVAAATPRAIVERLTAAVDTIMQSPEVRERLAALDIDVDYRRPDEFARGLKLQQTRFGEIIRKGNIRIE